MESPPRTTRLSEVETSSRKFDSPTKFENSSGAQTESARSHHYSKQTADPHESAEKDRAQRSKDDQKSSLIAPFEADKSRGRKNLRYDLPIIPNAGSN